jgi:hypothetical protein
MVLKRVLESDGRLENAMKTQYKKKSALIKVKESSSLIQKNDPLAILDSNFN